MVIYLCYVCSTFLSWRLASIRMSKKVHAETLNQLTNVHAVRGRLTLKDVDERQFRNESFREPKSSKNTRRYSKQTQKTEEYSKKTQKYSKNTQKYWYFQKNTNSLVNSNPKKTKHCSNCRRNHKDAILDFFDKTKDSTISSS